MGKRYPGESPYEALWAFAVFGYSASFVAGLRREDLGDDALAVELLDDLLLLLVTDYRFEFDNRIGASHGNTEMLSRNFQAGKQALNLGGDTFRVACGETKNQRARFEIKAVGAPRDYKKTEQNDRRGRSRNGVETGPRGHANGRFSEDGGGRGHADEARAVFQDRTGAQEANALNDVGRDARRTGIAIDVADFD